MRVLVIDPILQHGLPLVTRLILDGHDVTYVPIWGPRGDCPYRKLLGRGLGADVRPEEWMRDLDKIDVAAITGVEHGGTYAKMLAAHDVPVCAPGPKGTMLELSRKYGRDAFKRMGLRPTKAASFTDLSAVSAYIDKNPRRYVLKLDQGARAATETVVGLDPDGGDVRDAAERLRSTIGYLDGLIRVYLEEFTPGTEVGIGGWFNGERLMGPLLRTYEGFGGYAYDLRDEVPGEWIDRKRLEAVLREEDYRGPFDINGIVDESGAYRPIEWTARWGSGTTEMFCHAPDDLGALLLAGATGGKARPIRKAMEGKLVVLVNAKDEDEMDSPREIILPEGKDKLPTLAQGSASFWPIWPGRPKEGPWLALPIHPRSERRIGSYVASGADLGDALEQIEALSDKVGISGAEVELGRTREDLARKIEGETREDRFDQELRRTSVPHHLIP